MLFFPPLLLHSYIFELSVSWKICGKWRRVKSDEFQALTECQEGTELNPGSEFFPKYSLLFQTDWSWGELMYSGGFSEK